MSHPDADLHPVATGAAKKTVDKHSDPKPLKLYSGWFCPFVQRAWIILEEKGIPYEYIEVNPYNKPESLLKLNPRGLVPTLEYHGKPLFESTVICEFLEDAFPGVGPYLRPEDVYDRARNRIWSDYVTSRIIPSFHRFLQGQGSNAGGSDEDVDAARKEFLGHIKEFTKEMDETGPYFNGPTPRLVDFVIAPWAVRMWVFDHFKGGSGIPEEGKGGEDEKVWNRWRKFVRFIKDRKSVVNTTSETEHYMPIYQKYADDKAQSELAKAVRKGRGVP